MDFSQTFAISAAGMVAERTRVEISAMNLANANTIQSADGSGFQPLQVVLRASPAGEMQPGEFAEQVDLGLSESAGTGSSLSLPEILVQPTGTAPHKVYDPTNPFANDKGFITYPGVDTATEMMNMMNALRSYEANVAAMNIAKTMALKTLEIGGAS